MPGSTRGQVQHARTSDPARVWPVVAVKSRVVGQVGRARPVGDSVLRGHAGAASGRVAGDDEDVDNDDDDDDGNAEPEVF